MGYKKLQSMSELKTEDFRQPPNSKWLQVYIEEYVEVLINRRGDIKWKEKWMRVEGEYFVVYA